MIFFVKCIQVILHLFFLFLLSKDAYLFAYSSTHVTKIQRLNQNQFLYILIIHFQNYNFYEIIQDFWVFTNTVL